MQIRLWLRRGAAAGVLCAALGLGGCGRQAAGADSASTPPSSAAADASDAAAAKAFLDGLYAHYRTSKDNTFNMFDTSTHAVFDADTSKLLDEDTKALKGDLGTIDGDWLCDCQDFVSLRATVTVQSATPHTAKATADFKDVGMTDQGVRHAAFDLVKTPNGWRIHDIKDGDEPWLRAQLQDEIKSLAKGAGAVSG